MKMNHQPRLLEKIRVRFCSFPRLLCVTVLAFSFLLSSLVTSSQAVWIWDPKTGNWYNPKYAVKGSSKAQFQHAESFEKKGDWERAAKEYKKLVKAYPTSSWATMALVREAENYQKAGFYYEAYQADQLLIEKYPSYPDIEKIVEEEYKIGSLFLSGKKRKLKLIKLALFPSMDIAIEIFKKVVENFPFGNLADQAQFGIGRAYEKQKKYPEAMEAYKTLLKNHNKSSLRDEAKYRMGLCAYKQSRGASYDQAATDKALELFKEFLREYPESRRTEEVKAKIQELNTRKAQGLLQIAAYYNKVGDKKSAKVYYQQLLETFPDMEEGKTAKKRIEALGAKESPSPEIS
ncbi:MAG: outer membrane protein assembly factor BamD [Chlamydiae bacterium]|nr:outer membrane protein assembly factor BamD [Chlamydiota bacterium]MBI3278133.1 outer membrane protein assembly factor BamD [Chlamydiota bacterium]